MLKIGLTQRVEVFADRNERRDALDQAWTRLLFENGYIPVPLPNQVEQADALFDRIELGGIILTGGNDLSNLPGAENVAPERDEFERKLLGCCADRGIPVLGVCRGMQMLVRQYGGKVSPVIGHVGVGHSISVVSSAGLALTDREEVNSFHRFGASAEGIGGELQAAATASDGTVEAIVHRYLPQWGIMWHPERSPRDERDLELINTLFKGQRP